MRIQGKVKDQEIKKGLNQEWLTNLKTRLNEPNEGSNLRWNFKN